MYGLMNTGYGNLANLGLGYDRINADIASTSAGLYGQQGGSYDTSAMFGQGSGAGDIINAATGIGTTGLDTYGIGKEYGWWG